MNRSACSTTAGLPFWSKCTAAGLCRRALLLAQRARGGETGGGNSDNCTLCNEYSPGTCTG